MKNKLKAIKQGLKAKLKAKRGVMSLIILSFVIAFTMGNQTHDPLTALKNHIALGVAAATGKMDVYPKGAVSQLMVVQGQGVADQAAQSATSAANLKRLYQESIKYNPATGIVESSFTK